MHVGSIVAAAAAAAAAPDTVVERLPLSMDAPISAACMARTFAPRYVPAPPAMAAAALSIPADEPVTDAVVCSPRALGVAAAEPEAEAAAEADAAADADADAEMAAVTCPFAREVGVTACPFGISAMT